MPLFHIHGLIAGVLAPMSAARSVLHAGLQCAQVLWLDGRVQTHLVHRRADHAPDHPRARAATTPTSSAPTRCASSARRHRRCRRRSSPNSKQVFKAPLIEAYGMTEAAHQMASNPLPPAVRKPGSVGLAAGPEVAIMDDAGNLLPPDTIGEIVIRGENVTAGYENNPKANAEAFTHGWFRTGDQGTWTPTATSR
jgi:acyl-CoA synthetase (AMP-forming)/AMP-acid ligase II